MPLAGIFAAIAVVGLIVGGLSALTLRRSEAHPGMAPLHPFPETPPS